MATKNPRINITISNENLEQIKILVKKRKLSASKVIKSLIDDALELQEDLYFSKLADIRERETKKWVSHEDAWK